jgi:transposase-like protein
MNPRADPAGRRWRQQAGEGQLRHAGTCGEPHRGRITDAEKELVRANLDKVNKRLRESGKREIDPKDPEMKQRYGL